MDLLSLPARSCRRILVAEDSEPFRELITLALRGAGYAVTEAANGSTVLTLLQSAAHDALIIDLVMPKQEGIETIMEVRRHFPELPIIAMSGRSTGTVYFDLAKHVGANEVLTKPFRIRELITLIEDLRSRGAVVQPPANSNSTANT